DACISFPAPSSFSLLPRRGLSPCRCVIPNSSTSSSSMSTSRATSPASTTARAHGGISCRSSWSASCPGSRYSSGPRSVCGSMRRANAPIAAHFVGTRQPLGPLLAYAPWIEAGCAVAFLGGVAGWRWIRAGKRTAAVLAVALTSLAGAQLVLTGHDELAESHSTAPILSRIVAAHGPLRTDVPFYAIRMYDQTLPYYL